MLLFVLLKGLLMGLAIAAPVGPIALLCVRRTLAQGRGAGLATGLGAATADGFYGVVAAFGLAALSNFLLENTSVLQLCGGLFLCYLGLSTFFAKSSIAGTAASSASSSDASFSAAPVAKTSAETALRDSDSELFVDPSALAPPQFTASRQGATMPRLFFAYTSTFVLTLTNPATIFSFIAIFAGLGITQSNAISAMTLVLGVFLGSALWWLILVSGVSYLRQRVTPKRLARFNRIATRVFGVLIFVFGVVALWTR